MGDICNYIKTLMLLNLCRPLVESTQKYTFTFDNEVYDYPIPRVVNGQKAILGQFPYQIALKWHIGSNVYATYCGGALIGPSKILSAAHCLAKDANWCLRNCFGYAVAGTLLNKEDRRKRHVDEQWRTMSSSLIPEAYKFPRNDIALAFTHKHFDMDQNVNTLPIAQKTIDYGDTMCIVSGYGKLSETGDSGGPLVCFNTNDPNDAGQGVIVGVVSGMSTTGGTFFTRVSSYYQFLQQNNASIPTINVVALKRRKNTPGKTYMTYCGGALIGTNKILTAAHCVEKKKPNKFSIQGMCPWLLKNKNRQYAVAATLLNEERFEEDSETQWRELHTAHVPKGYEFPIKDIAVVLVKKPFVFDQYVNSLPFAEDYVDYGNRKCTVSGYGKVSETKTSTNLLWAQLDLLSTRLCKIKFRSNMLNFICTSSDVTDVLQGDSGGPLVCFNSSDPQERDKGVIVGVVSGSHPKYGTFFTRVSSYRHFIESSTEFNKSSNFKTGMTCYFALISLKLKFVLF